MAITKNLGMLVLAIYLIVVGVLGLGVISIGAWARWSLCSRSLPAS